MGKTSNDSKQKWVSKNYRQVKVLVTPAVAEAFKMFCAKSGQSVNKSLSIYMESAVHKKPPKADPVLRIETRPHRRKTMQRLIACLDELLDAERDYNENIPENLKGGEKCEQSSQCIENIEEAISLLTEAF